MLKESMNARVSLCPHTPLCRKGHVSVLFSHRVNFIFTPDFSLWTGNVNLYYAKDPLSPRVPSRVGDRGRTLSDCHLDQLPGTQATFPRAVSLRLDYLVESGTTHPFAPLPTARLPSLPLFFLFLSFFFHQRYLLHAKHSA